MVSGHKIEVPPDVAAEIEKLTGMAINDVAPLLEAAVGHYVPIVGPFLGFLAPFINSAIAKAVVDLQGEEKKVLGH
jgi:hypothetical protein